MLVGAVLLFDASVRRVTLLFVRLPFTLLTHTVGVLVTLPRLPSLVHDNAALQGALIQRQFEAAQLREALRQAQEAQALLSRGVIPPPVGGLPEAIPAPSGPAFGLPTGGGIIASVIGRSTLPTQHTVLLNRGERDGLTLESVILDAHGVIGRVVELGATTCLVLLLTDPESRVAGLVERSRETGLLIGRGQGTSEFVYLDAEADIQEGDRIVTAGLGGPFPKGLLLGTVARVSRDELSGTAWALVKPAAQLGRIEDVLCLPSATR